ncbi:cytochrome P450 [Streptomyces sp. A7024]|uniref:Cytochrome P450 n=1 Tax=Streptomyces coryli TaxID=1128680 RepID=A0A6G4U7Z1_9ACTN|nr:cytochrome P450 [Streptomyces coryli]NGN67508.1 cytochrome P450 [Streptomyces coryli]
MTATEAAPPTGGTDAAARPLPSVTPAENARLLALFYGPVLLNGVFKPRPRMRDAGLHLDQARRSMELLYDLRERYAGAPLRVRALGGPSVLVLDPGDVTEVLGGPVDVWAVGTGDKVRGFGGIQPDALVVTNGPLRHDRRAFNEYVLAARERFHPYAERFAAVAAEEADRLLATGGSTVLDYDATIAAMNRIGRRVVLGDRAADDEELSRLLGVVTGEANWVGLRKWKAQEITQALAQLNSRLRGHLAAAEPRSVAALFAEAPQTSDTKPDAQVVHWLMAMQVVRGAATMGLALLATHDEQRERVRAEAAADPRGMPYTRACVQEAARLWPPVAALMRETTAPVTLGGHAVPGGIGVTIPTLFHNRDRVRLTYADRFAPEEWLDDGPAERDLAVCPFSRGEAMCAGTNVGVLLAASFVSRVLERADVTLLSPRLSPRRPLPLSCDSTATRLRLTAR